MTRFAVIRVPSAGPPALIAEPYDFKTEAQAEARIAQIEAAQLMTHHTHLEVLAYQGGLAAALAERGALR